MPRASTRLGKLRSIHTRIPGGASITKYFKRKPSAQRKKGKKK